jgi:hypothetical protein
MKQLFKGQISCKAVFSKQARDSYYHGILAATELLNGFSVWGIIVAHFAENWGFYTLLTGLPMFMQDILNYKLDETGFLAALPYLLMACIVQSAGKISESPSVKQCSLLKESLFEILSFHSLTF